MSNQGENKIRSVTTALRIFETVKDFPKIGVTESAQKLNLPKSTVYSHLNTLHDRKYVAKKSGKYSIGLKFLEFGEHKKQRMELWEVAKPEMQKLANETDELVNLMLEEYGEGVYIGLVSGAEAVQLDT